MKVVSDKYSLKIGDWVKFSNKQRSSFNKKQQDIFSDDQVFLVLSRTDQQNDKCRCYLISIKNNKILDYYPRMSYIGYVNIDKAKIYKFSKEELEKKYNKEKIDKTYECAKAYIIKRKTHFSKELTKTVFNPNNKRIKNKFV